MSWTVNDVRENLKNGLYEGEVKDLVEFLVGEVDSARASAMGYGSVTIAEGICDPEECEDLLQWRREGVEAGLWEPGTYPMDIDADDDKEGD